MPAPSSTERGGTLGEPTLTSRERILALLAEEPGLHLRELPRRLRMSLRAVRYHLDELADADAVTAYRSGRYERWFPARTFSAVDRTTISALRVRGERAVLEHLLHMGAARFADLRVAVSVSPGSLSRYLTQLIDEDLVVLGSDRRYRLRDPAALRFRLSVYRRRFPDLLADVAREIFDESV